ncbi:hypothetical protein Tco_0771252 [Tanacetum coccineum]|uniref:Uncharacterized protein n=1 Tax=Tanacetum coccineum TaxID=301880 RepID=A0ABQ4ZGF6_9ASTR
MWIAINNQFCGNDGKPKESEKENGEELLNKRTLKLGYDATLDYENEVLQSVFMNTESRVRKSTFAQRLKQGLPSEYQDYNGGPCCFLERKKRLLIVKMCDKKNKMKNTIDKEDQVFLRMSMKAKRQEQDANDATEALRKEFEKDIKDLLFQVGALKLAVLKTLILLAHHLVLASP